MKADSLKVTKVFSSGGDIHYVLPHFQREYTWEKSNWDTLLEDACDIHDEMQPASDDSQSLQELEHFLGSLVVINDGTRNGTVTAFKLVDGQQRLTTISLLLCALKSLVLETHPGLAKKIQKLLVNSDEDGDVYFKILPTTKYGDRIAYTSIIQGETPPVTESRIPQAYDYLLKELRQKIAGGDIEAQKLFEVITNIFQVVFIDLNQNESPYKIFESLNAKGKPLSQADLVRNYIAMKLPASGQEKLFSNHWSKIEGLLQEKRTVGRSRLGELTAFLRHYLAMRSGVLCSEEHVYARFRDRIEKEFSSYLAFAEEIATLRRFAEHYDKLLRPENEPQTKIREAMQRLNSLEVSTGYPFLLAVYDAYSEEDLTDAEFGETLAILENYLVRRYLVGEPTNFLNKMFPALWAQVDPERFNDSLRKALAGKNYPSDAKVRQSLPTRRLYDKSDFTRARTTLILETINRHLSSGSGGYTVLDNNSTLEHVLPQTIGIEWQEELGSEWQRVHNDHVHTFGNLTLVTQEWNSSLSNAPFLMKQPKLAAHALRLNCDYFSQVTAKWNEEAIRERGIYLTDKVLTIWSALVAQESSSDDSKGLPSSERAEPSNFHSQCVKKIGAHLGTRFIKHGGFIKYISDDKQYRLLCSVSKRYERTNEVEYWYAFHPNQGKFLSEHASSKAYVGFGCGSHEKIILMLYAEFEPLTQNMWTTTNGDKMYWHVKIYEKEGKFYLAQPESVDRLDITHYLLPVGATG